ncbi:hypothetical protein FOYG_02214 [Fusarium oxysporum NRRL 32931]|uniref:NAD(P)-binding domain-containing protein n=1 Tax=Fusarium oxysporum NRRL 32931 TaxID=660029 RepID=W9IXW1_FUSOX|nr:hypothetical protein FOYG_02214 [Fusarium oxysporum NRRL 32931]
MYAIFSATGKAGYATAVSLRKAGMHVRAMVRNESKAAPLREIGCETAIADLFDPETQPSRVLAISDYGAHVKNDIGMPTICRGLEERLTRIGGHKIFLQSAEHIQGWERVFPAVKESGTLQTIHYPVDNPLPTISALDLGPIAARLLLRPLDKSGVDVVHAEGPQRYSAADVANALGQHLGRSIETSIVPWAQWEELFERVVKPSLAELLIKANDAQNQGGLVDIGPDSNEVCFGTTTLFDALGQLLMSL